jgi:hypothetical protein
MEEAARRQRRGKSELEEDIDTLQLSFPQRTANYLYFNPIQHTIMTSIPVVAGIFHYQNTVKSDIIMSRRIMHTRVLGQFSVLTVLVMTMGFQSFMDTRGGPYK